MKKSTVTVTFDDEQLQALKMYLSEKKLTVETELEEMLQALYLKSVPLTVRDFITKKAKNEMEKENKAIRRMKSNPVTKVNIEQSNE